MVRANSKVLFNPFDSPAAVRSSNHVATTVVTFRDRLGIESGHESQDAKPWRAAAGDVVEKVRVTGLDGAAAAKRFGDETLDRATQPFRAVDIDGDGVPDQPRAAAAADQAGAAIKSAASGLAGAFGTLFQRKVSPPEGKGEGDPEPDADGV